MITAKPEMTAHYLGVVRGRCDGQPIVDVMTGKVLPGICRTYVPCQLDGNHAYFDLGGYSWRVPLDGTACERLPRDARGRYLNTVYCLLSKMEG